MLAALTFFASGPIAKAAPIADQTAPRPLITLPIDDSRMVTLPGNLRSEATAANDLGEVAEDLPLEHMLLELKRSPERQAAFDSYTAELTERTSPNYHKWLTPEQIGSRYGLAQADLAKITGWLQSHGLKVDSIYPGSTMIDFSGTAGQVRETFQTEIHSFDVRGVKHIANYSNPKIPAALSEAVVGVVSLNDFRPHAMHKQVVRQHIDPKSGALITAAVSPNYTFTVNGSTYEAVVPADLATIYNLKPLFAAGYSGQGQTIVVIEDTNVYSTADWTKFRSTFGLSSYTSGSFTQVHPGGCTNPGTVSGNEGEATLDAEWASAAAPNATIELASCADTITTFGGLIALQKLLSAGSPPAIVSISYGECEAENGASANAAYNSTYQQAAAEGVSVFVSSGDEGAASCDANHERCTHGIGVSGFASTPYNVAVGGTDFGDTYAGHQQHLLEHHQHVHLRLGEVLHPRNPVERLLRQHACLLRRQRLQPSPTAPAASATAPPAKTTTSPRHPAAAAPAAAPPARPQLPASSAEPATATPNPPGRPCYGTSRRRRARYPRRLALRCQRRLGPLLRLLLLRCDQTATSLHRRCPATGPEQAVRPSPRPSWPASRRW